MAGGSAEQGDSSSTQQTRQSEREEGMPSLVSLALVRRATAPANAAIIDLKDWRHGVYEGLLFEEDKKKFWVDEKLHKNCLLVLPKAMYLEGGEREITWQWIQTKERCFGGNVDVWVPMLLWLSWLYIKGSFHTNVLSPMTTYEVAFVVKIRRSSNSWPLPVNLELHLPDGSKLVSTENLAKKPKEKWIKLRIGKFLMDPKNVGEMYFYLSETCQIYKSGLVLKGLRFDPKD